METGPSALPWLPPDVRSLERACASLTLGQSGPAGVRDDILSGHDPLGEAFCQLRSAVQRRAMGAFYTPHEVVNAMVGWVLARRPDRVVDCGCGSGRFSVALRRAGFTGAIVAVDVDPLAVAMTRAHLCVAVLPPVDLRCDDFLTFALPPCEGITAFVGNPPYVRHHDLSVATKHWARRAAEQLGVPVSGLAGLHVLFLVAVALRVQPEDIGCFITSSEWLDTGYGSTARALLGGAMGLDFLTAMRADARPFEDAMSTAVVFGWRCGHRAPARLRCIEHSWEFVAPDTGRVVTQDQLRETPRWTPLLEPQLRRSADARVTLGSIARVHRGVATGDNGFFVLPREQGRRLGLEPWLVPCVHRARILQECGGRLSAAHCSHGLLRLPDELPDSLELRSYLAHGESCGVPTRYLCAHRRSWWRLGGKPPPPVVVTYMARRPPSFAVNPDGCALVNIAHGIYPREPMEPGRLEALVDWLNNHAHELTGHRSYHGGLKKWEPSEMASVLVPARFAEPADV